MTRFAVDAGTLLAIVRGRLRIGGDDHLVGTASLRSDVMALLYAEVREESLSDDEARTDLEALASVKVRLLGDRVSRSVAWKIARRLDLVDPALAEILAVASLQADALVTDDPVLRAAAQGIVPLAELDRLPC